MEKDSQSQSDLRSFIQDVEAAGKLYRVKQEVDPHKNIGVLAEESDRVILFENVAGYEGWSVVANLLGDRDLEAVAFKTARDKVLATVAGGFDKGPRPQRLVETGPVKEVIWHDEEANLNRLPVVIHSELDAGPYIGSGIGIVRDPDTGIQNTTYPRMNTRDGKRCPFYIFSPHTRQIYMKYGQRNEPMPMAVFIGHHPAWEMMAASSLHHPGHVELAYVGSLLDEETEMVKCETIDVEVPARAEIVIEGEVGPGDMGET
jgi:2,5-furandicarboxylate decarboxylase 1